MRLAELGEHLGQRQPVGHHQCLVHQRFVGQRDGLVVQHALEQVLGIDIAHHVVDIAHAHGVGGKRLFGDPGADDVVAVVLVEEGNAVALRHGRAYGARVKLKHIGDYLLLSDGEQAGLGAHFGQREDVFGGDALVSHRGQAQELCEARGQPVEQPHQRFEHHHQPLHGPAHQHGQALGLGHRQALGQQIGQQDEQRSDQSERGQKSDGGRTLGAQPGLDPFCKEGGECAFADHAAQNGHRVDANLCHGEIFAWLLLRANDKGSSRIAIIHHLPQPQAARSGQRNLRRGEKGAEGNQQGNGEEALRHIHKQKRLEQCRPAARIYRRKRWQSVRALPILEICSMVACRPIGWQVLS